jgi:hypothetical protein
MKYKSVSQFIAVFGVLLLTDNKDAANLQNVNRKKNNLFIY